MACLYTMRHDFKLLIVLLFALGSPLPTTELPPAGKFLPAVS